MTMFAPPESPRLPGGPKLLVRHPTPNTTTLDLDELQLRIRTASATQLPSLASPSAFNSISQPAPVPSSPPKAMGQCGSCPNIAAPVGGGSPPSAGSPLNASNVLLGNKSTQWKQPQIKSALSETHSSLPPPSPGHGQREAEGAAVPEKKKSGTNLGRSISQMFKGALKGSLFQTSSSNNAAAQSGSKPSSAFSRNSKPNRSGDLDDEAGPCDVLPSPRAEAASPPPITVVATKLPPDSTKDSCSASSPAAPKTSHSSPQVLLPLSSLQAPASPAAAPPTPFATVQSPQAPGTPPVGELPHSHPSQGVAKTHLMSQKSMEYAAAAEAEARMARRSASISKYVGTPSMLLVVTRDLPARMLRPIWSLRDYTVLEKMYTGYASNVYKAKCKYSGVLVCLKSYTLGALCELNRYQIFREVRVHSSLCHENVIKLYGAFQQGDQVVLVQEYANSGDLFTLLHKYGGRLPERNAVEVVLQPFLSVINYLHSNGIVHRDIKPENILFTSDMRLKLCDFGLAINMHEERAVTRVGTLEYMAPEVLDCPFKNKPEENKGNRMLQYSYHVDTWAVGVLTYELLVGLPPFNDKQRNAVEEKIRAAPPRFPSRMSEQCRDFITMALEKNPLERPTVTEMLNHPWMRMHKRSNSVQQLSTLERQQSSGNGHGASRSPSQNLSNFPIHEEEPAHGLPPQQLPSPQSVLCSPTHAPAPPKAKPVAITATKPAPIQAERHMGGGKGAYDVDVLSSSYTGGALPLTAFPGMVNAAAGKMAVPNPGLFVPVLDKHIAQQERQLAAQRQAAQQEQVQQAQQRMQAAQQEQVQQAQQRVQAAQQARLRQMKPGSRPNSFDAGSAVAPVVDTLSSLPRGQASFLPASTASVGSPSVGSPRAASLPDADLQVQAQPAVVLSQSQSPPKSTSSLTKALRSLA